MSSTFIYDAPIPYNESQPYDFVATWGGSGTAPVVLPHLSAELTLQGDGTFNFWQQGTIDEVSQCVEMVVGTVQGQRTVVSGFGVPLLTFQDQTSGQQKVILDAINKWEPRAIASVQISIDNQNVESVQVNISLRKGSIN